jgi:hypothetical protein
MAGIGAMGNIGAGGKYADTGLQPWLEAASVFGPMAIRLGRLAGKGWNDRAEGHIIGSVNGRPLITSTSDLGGMSEEAFAAHAQQAGRENQRIANKFVGTPRRRPMAGGLGTPGDTSDIGSWTP